MRRAHETQQGFTLIEAVMVIVILGAIAAVAAQMMGTGFQAYFTGRNVADADWQARVALERMTRELRTIRSRAAVDLTMGANTVTFNDADGNNITYTLAGTTLNRNTDVLADGINLPAGPATLFTYLDSNLNPATPATVYFISVQFVVTQGNSNATFRATVNPRSFQ